MGTDVGECGDGADLVVDDLKEVKNEKNPKMRKKKIEFEAAGS